MLAAKINEHHRACINALGEGLRHAMEAGKLLIEAKGHHKHGTWLKWLKGNFDFTPRTAQCYMRCARELDLSDTNAQRVAHLGYRKMLEHLATPRSDTEGPESLVELLRHECSEYRTALFEKHDFLQADAHWRLVLDTCGRIDSSLDQWTKDIDQVEDPVKALSQLQRFMDVAVVAQNYLAENKINCERRCGEILTELSERFGIPGDAVLEMAVSGEFQRACDERIAELQAVA